MISHRSKRNGQGVEECPSCAGLGQVIGVSFSQDVFRCKSCGLFYLRKSVRTGVTKNNNWYGELRDCPQSEVDVFVRDMEFTYLRQLSALEKLVVGRSILDFGCGIGIFLSLAKKRCWNVYGIETSQHAAYFAEKNFKIKYSLSLAEFAPNSLDVIRISHVLEHIPEPRELLPQLHRVIHSNGILFVIVPNAEPLCLMMVNRLRRMVYKKPKFTGGIAPDFHVIGFSVSSLIKLLTSLGFKPIDVFTISMGNRDYYPMFYDGLLKVVPLSSISINSLFRYWLPQFIDNLGNRFKKGCWIVGYFRKV